MIIKTLSIVEISGEFDIGPLGRIRRKSVLITEGVAIMAVNRTSIEQTVAHPEKQKSKSNCRTNSQTSLGLTGAKPAKMGSTWALKQSWVGKRKDRKDRTGEG